MKDRVRDLTPPRVWAAAARVRGGLRRFGYVRERWARPLGTRPPIALAVCAIFRNEARYLAEWVSFHRIQGVERFYLYDNRSSDDWRSALAPEIESGIVEAQRWPFVPGQVSAYNDCLRRHRDDARWIAFIDIDEFLFSPIGHPLPAVLRSFDTHPGVVVNWRMYGTSGWEQAPEGLVIESYLRRAPDDLPAHRFVKSIVNPRSALGCMSSHYFRLRGVPVGEDRRPVPSPARKPTADLLRINHYYSKSAEEFDSKSVAPTADFGTPDLDRFSIPPDEVLDDCILRFEAELKALLSSRSRPPVTTD
jgi:Glycosyltransferase family 92